MVTQIFLFALCLLISMTEALNACDNNPCQNSGMCSPSFQCTCTDGWGGKFCNVLQQLQHDFETNFKFENPDNNLKLITAGAGTIPNVGYEGTSHYGRVESGSSFELHTNKIGNDEIKYCIQFGYFMQGRYTELSVIQRKTSEGSEDVLWTNESPNALGTFGNWEVVKLPFFGKSKSTLVIKGESSYDSGVLAIDEIKVHTGSCW